MKATHRYKLVAVAEVKVERSERQRRVIDTAGLKDSIARHGVLQPIIIKEDMTLVIGERRLTACRELGLEKIPARFFEELSPIEAQVIELEENLKRSDLPWQDQVRAVGRLHLLYATQDAEWTQAQTAEAIGLSPPFTSQILRVHKDLDSPRLAGATGVISAYNILSRVDDRKIGDAVSDIIEAGASMFDGGAKASQDSTAAKPAPEPESLLNADFLKWAPAYTGQPFNFIHCDFPFGINAFGGSMSGRDKWTHYDDKEDIYWTLLRCLCQNLDKVMSPSAHLMFWFSMEHYERTLRMFKELAPSLEVQLFPLLWVKSDNVGILSDSKRGPRRIYETALIASREDRLILRATSNAYSAPTDKQHHPSTKPEPVLRYFMQMFVDESTRLLDPTCGSGSALRAAESLGAKQVLGLELDKEHYDNAKSALRQFRVLRKASQK